MLQILQGKKTYILSIVAIVWAITGWLNGWVDTSQAQEYIWLGLIAMTGRSAISKVEKNP